ncbi:MAG TPA: glycoside hydrolase family 57 protein [Rhodocyclaceae bacterium]|nr:glycoside hydrolase family 57 protein [Rhodocyclaceae bacterium]
MQKIDLVFLWHMHQPDYRDHSRPGAPEFVLPWVYLHAIKDYTDMAAHLERHPQVRAVINFVPVLAEQIEDYASQFARGIGDGKHFRDPLLRLLATPEGVILSNEDKRFLLDACFLANHATMLDPFPDYQRLHTLFSSLSDPINNEPVIEYLSDAYFFDLVTWYHLAWSGEYERRNEKILQTLIGKGQNFTLEDRHALLEWIGRTLKNILPRYTALAKRGQIELSCTPQTHPLSPLLLDLRAGQETVPEAPAPSAPEYPGGAERVRRHIVAAINSHTVRFGVVPTGMWPAEGAISTAFVRQMASEGVRWIASGEGVLHNSLNKAGMTVSHPAWQPWKLDRAPGMTMFFRDEHLSDLIGFEYGKWHSGEAAQHFVEQVGATATMAPNAEQEGQKPMVAVILDGENAWEHYPYNGWYFFEELYTLLASSERIHTTTFAALLKERPAATATLPELTAGSWVYGTLSTWVGDTAKNHAWDLLAMAKATYDRVMVAGTLTAGQRIEAENQLAICESSDWFWWFGDYNPGPSVASFDQLYRRNLANLYRCLQLTPPATLDVPISAGSSDAGAEGGGTMRRAAS